jgi:hypothetical protein
MPTTPTATSFAKDIAPLFTATDVDHMKPMGLDLSDYGDVKAQADAILARLKDAKNPMPPKAAGGPWPKDRIALFERWVKEGKKP